MVITNSSVGMDAKLNAISKEVLALSILINYCVISKIESNLRIKYMQIILKIAILV